MLINLAFSGKTGASRILIGEQLASLGRFSLNGRPGVVITDKNVFRLYHKEFPSWPVVTINPGERHKTLRTVSSIYREFLKLNVDRRWLVAGVGGGIVCDVAGFAASTYLRGLEFGLAATTLLAQVDAALGGKNGVNLCGYKNMVGTIRQPGFIICDYGVLSTLPDKEIRCGLAEIIKSAAIADGELFDFLEKNMTACLRLEREAIVHAIERTCRVKIAIVVQDELERNVRRKLNFGHTIGHALERIFRLGHGEAVAIGMAAAAKLSVKRRLLEPEEESRLVRLIKKARLPTAMRIPSQPLRRALLQDKKRGDQRIHFVFLKKLGEAVIEQISREEVIEVVDDLC